MNTATSSFLRQTMAKSQGSVSVSGAARSIHSSAISLAARHSSSMHISSLPHSRYGFAPPTSAQLLSLRQRLRLPYAAPGNVSARARSSLDPTQPCHVLALDVGDRYVGVAVSDATNARAIPLTTIYRKENVSGDAVHQQLQQLQQSRRHHSTHPFSHADMRTRDARGQLRVRPAAGVAADLIRLLIQHQCVAIVVGMPLSLEFEVEVQCQKTILFMQEMQREWTTWMNVNKQQMQPSTSTHPRASKNVAASSPSASTTASLPASASSFVPPAILWWDERLSSVDARQTMTRHGVKASKQAKQLDRWAAAIILQELLDRMNDTR